MNRNPLTSHYICKKQKGSGKGRSFAHDFAHGIFKVLPAITAVFDLLKKVTSNSTPSEWIQKAVDFLKTKEADRQYIQEDLDVAQKGDYTWEQLLTFQEAGYNLNHTIWEQLQDEMSQEAKDAIEKRRIEKLETYERQFMMDNLTYPEASAKLDSADPNFGQNLRTLINNRAIYQREKLYDMTPEQRANYNKFYNTPPPTRPIGQAPVDLVKLRNDTAKLYSGNPTQIAQPTAEEQAIIRARIAAKRAPLIAKK